jgi:hypothetical protein
MDGPAILYLRRRERGAAFFDPRPNPSAQDSRRRTNIASADSLAKQISREVTLRTVNDHPRYI